MYNNHKQSILIRRSPVVFIKTIIALEFAALGLFFIAQPLAFYKEIYNRYVYQQLISYEYHLITIFFVAVFEVVLMLYVFVRWHRESYRVDAKQIFHTHGAFFQRQSIVSISNIHSASLAQGPVGKFAGYGTIKLDVRNSDKKIELRDIPSPQKVLSTILKLKQGMALDAGSGAFSENPKLDIERILKSNEHEQIEFKATFRWDIRLKKVNRNLEKAVMKTISAFLNSDGGHLAVGIGDSGKILGLSPDYKTLSRNDADGFENHFNQIFKSMIGPEFRQFVRLHFFLRGTNEVCMVEVIPSGKPAYLLSDGRDEFYIRTGNATSALSFREAHNYIGSRWSS